MGGGKGQDKGGGEGMQAWKVFLAALLLKRARPAAQQRMQYRLEYIFVM